MSGSSSNGVKSFSRTHNLNFKEEEFRKDNKCDSDKDLIAFFSSTNTRRDRALGVERKVSFSSVEIRQYNRILDNYP